jgi:hypothetical protein
VAAIGECPPIGMITRSSKEQIMTDQSRELLLVIKGVLLRCWIAGFVLLGVVFAVTQLAGGVIAELHGSLFDLSAHEIDLILYCALGLIKLGVVMGFFIPWLSLTLVMAKQEAS